MKILIKLFALLTALCLLAGCAASKTQTDTPQGSDGTAAQTVASTEAAPTVESPEATPEDIETTPVDIETTTADIEATPTDVETTAPVGEPEGWEEEWPPEYPLAGYKLLDGAIQQTGRLNKYRYEPLEGAEDYMNLAADYVREVLDCGDTLTMREDSPHDGYANWFMDAPNGHASVSGTSVTGRFGFGLYPGFDRVLEMTERTITDRAAMEQAAWAFVNRFTAITGDLELIRAVDEVQDYHDERSSELKDVHVPAVVYTFCSAEHSRLLLELQEGLQGPVLCGDSNSEDRGVHCFTVTVWPDGTVVRGNNDITRARAVPDGSLRMPDEGYVAEHLCYFTSFAENDTIVIEEIRVDSYSVYFGHAEIEPLLTMTYYFESDPTEQCTTEFVLSGSEDE